MLYSATADSGHDFQPIAISQRYGIKLAARHDFAVAFDGDALTDQFQHGNQLTDIERLRKLPGRAVDGEFDQLQIP